MKNILRSKTTKIIIFSMIIFIIWSGITGIMTYDKTQLNQLGYCPGNMACATGDSWNFQLGFPWYLKFQYDGFSDIQVFRPVYLFLNLLLCAYYAYAITIIYNKKKNENSRH